MSLVVAFNWCTTTERVSPPTELEMGNIAVECAGPRATQSSNISKDAHRVFGIDWNHKNASETTLWDRVMREMSANTRDLVMRAVKRVDAGQLNEDQIEEWMASKVTDLKLLTDGVLHELWDKCKAGSAFCVPRLYVTAWDVSDDLVFCYTGDTYVQMTQTRTAFSRKPNLLRW